MRRHSVEPLEKFSHIYVKIFGERHHLQKKISSCSSLSKVGRKVSSIKNPLEDGGKDLNGHKDGDRHGKCRGNSKKVEWKGIDWDRFTPVVVFIFFGIVSGGPVCKWLPIMSAIDCRSPVNGKQGWPYIKGHMLSVPPIWRAVILCTNHKRRARIEHNNVDAHPYV